MNISGQDLVAAKRYKVGTHRGRDPRETLEAYKPLMPRLGITRLANVTGLDYVGLPVFMAIRPNSRNISVSQGKGLTVEAAAASALMESIEGWHAEQRMPTRRASVRELRGSAPVIEVEGLARRVDRLDRHADVQIEWVEGLDLMSGTRLWLPEDTVSGNMVFTPGAQPLFRRGSNGLASGNNLLEAICHGLCEVIERDSCSLWRLQDDDAATKETQLDLESIDSPLCREYIDRLRSAGLHVAAWDATSDIDVPAYVALVMDDPGMHTVGMSVGQGCHLSHEVALLRALSEAVQSRLTHIAGSRDDMSSDHVENVRRHDQIAATLEHINEPAPTRRYAERASAATDYFDQDLGLLLARLQASGIRQVGVVDLTNTEIGVSVVKVVVPGVEAGVGEGYHLGARARAVLEARVA